MDETTRESGSRPYRPEGIDDAFVGTANLPTLGWRGTLRWTWRQLTSMRVALMLLMLLAVAAVPGSVLPQRPQNPAAVVRYLQDNPGTGAWLDRLGFFDVYTSVWFSAIYLLLFVSLVGCILPRTAAHARALRAAPPRVPRRFERFPVHVRTTTDASPAAVVEAAASHLRGPVRWLPRFRVEVRDAPAAGASSGTGPRAVAAERGYLRETGNLVFHLALLGLLVAVAVGQLVHYRGQAIVTEGRGFANAVVDYDTFESGSMFRASSLVPFSMTLDSFDAVFSTDAVSFAQSRDFTAHVTVRTPGDDEGRAATVKVNHPLVVEGAKIYLQGNGYAPEVTIRDSAGEVAFSGRVPFLPEDTMYTSRGVIKVPDVSPGLEQIGLVGYLLPTGEITVDGARSVFPEALNPMLVLDVYTGDLGLDDGLPQNVYRLDTTSMTPVVDDTGTRVQVVVTPGRTADLPNGLGTITFEALPRYVALDLRHDPSVGWILAFALAALTGLAVSLFTPRRRVWVRAWSEAAPGAGDGSDDAGARRRTVVAVAGLARGDDAGLQGEVDALLAALPGVRPSDEGTTITPSPADGGDRGPTEAARRAAAAPERPHDDRS